MTLYEGMEPTEEEVLWEVQVLNITEMLSELKKVAGAWATICRSELHSITKPSKERATSGK